MADAIKVDLQEKLILLSRNVDSVFSLTFGDGSKFDSLSIVRRVPNKRIVCFGKWREQEVYAKIFLGHDKERYAARDLRGVNLLEEAKINTPAILYHGAIADQHAYVVIFAAIAQSQNAEEVWCELDDEQRFLLAKALITELAHHHNGGILQTDLYLKNFLVRGSMIYTIDGDAIQSLPRFFRERHALKNLAILLSKFDVLDYEAWFSGLIEAYTTERKTRFVINRESLRKSVEQLRKKVVYGYVNKKVFRQCTDVWVSKTFRRYLAIASGFYTPQLLDALNRPDALLDAIESERLKSGNTCTVTLTKIGAEKIVVKRYNIKNTLHAIGRAFRVSRAAKSWANAHRLQMYRILTAAPIALLECRFGFIRHQAYFLAENIEAPDVGEYFSVSENALPNDQDKKTAAVSIAEMFYKLNLLKITHGDFKTSNIKMVGNQPLLIDLDSMREYRWRWLFERQHIRDMRRFMRNWQDGSQVKQLLVEAFNEVYKDTRLLKRSGLFIK